MLVSSLWYESFSIWDHLSPAIRPRFLPWLYLSPLFRILYGLFLFVSKPPLETEAQFKAARAFLHFDSFRSSFIFVF